MILRGLWERRTLSLVVLIIAVVPIASAAVGPIYSAAARTTIVREAVRTAPLEGRGWRYTTTSGGIQAKVGAFTRGAGFTNPPIFGMEATSGRADDKRAFSLVWQDGQCEHLTLAEGRCPRASMEVMAGQASGFALGQTIHLSAVRRAEVGDAGRDPAPLKVVGIYRPGSPADPFWFGRTLFAPPGRPEGDKADALFTVPETRLDTYIVAGAVDFTGARQPEAGWTDYGIVFIDTDRIEGTDIDVLAAMQAAAENAGSNEDTIVFSRVADVLRVVSANAGSLGVPTLLVIAQLVGLGWMLLFQTVGDLVRARGAEIALARLRGHGRARVWRFALAEPLLLLAVAVPLGLLLGRAAAGTMIGALLPAGVPVRFPVEAAPAGVAAMLGGVLAAAPAAWRTATRPVTEEWRRTPRRSARGWVLDAVVLSITALGLVELLATGVITDVSGQSSSAMAVPGLVALGVALLAGRALPVLTRRLFGLTRRHGGLGPFLALRQVARGPVTAGSVVVLGAAFGLATFAVSAWSATSGDYEETARFHNGAPTAITVRPVEPRRLIEAVNAADPGGRTAAPVIKVPGPPEMVATDPARLAAVGYWRPELAGGRTLAEAAAALPGPATPRVWLRGDRFRLTADHDPLPKGWSVRLFATLRVPGQLRPVQIPLGALTGRSGTHAWNLPPGCAEAACELRAVRGETTPPPEAEEDLYVRVTVTGLATRANGRWHALDLPSWRVDEDPDARDGTFVVTVPGNQTLRPYTYEPRQAGVAVGALGGKAVPGLDNAYAGPVRTVLASAAGPGLTGVGVLVDLEQADRMAYGVHDKAVFQVWTRSADPAALERALEEQGLSVVSRRTSAGLAASFAGQGPGLALMLLLVSALAAAALALGRTVLALFTAARRRTYELAALEASGARVAALRVALLLEQVITVATGTLAGLVAGLVAARAALGRIPQFAEPPVTPPLPHEVALAPVAAVVGAALLVSLLAAVLVSEALLRGIRVERLRDAPA
ncbi:FtsX-like permease family protein [Nonomuraea phyllanthi]|uniref:FtsX-like permease family protein n=1 Tax=Nonomuraea phyllanthi TaxID=2219224 RepID=A0A5C4W9S2_9ACTN|nr:FtsX-like permease family protein [Nonomuraea phyllanthi]KAB8192758.1 FtsX-like permease family protein [Nonomuraea phyllanthi]